MALEDKKIPYEILIRFGLDGSPAGAHVQYRRHIMLDGEVLKDEPLPAEPIDLKGFPTSAVMKDATRDALAKVGTLSADVSTLTEALGASEGRLAEALSSLDQSRASLAAAEDARSQAIANVTLLTARLDEAMATIEALRAPASPTAEA